MCYAHEQKRYMLNIILCFYRFLGGLITSILLILSISANLVVAMAITAIFTMNAGFKNGKLSLSASRHPHPPPSKKDQE